MPSATPTQATPFETALLAYEPFAYAPGSIEGQNGGSGFRAGWSNVIDPPNDTYVQAEGLASPNGPLATEGGALVTNPRITHGRVYRELSTPLGAPDTTAWVGFLIRPDSPNDRYGGLSLGGDTPMGHGGVFIGGSIAAGRWGLNTAGDLPGQRVYAPDSVVATGRTTLLVARIDFAAGPDTVTLYVNPAPGIAPDVAAGMTAVKNDIDLGLFTRLTISSGDNIQYTVDELRLGTSYAALFPTN